MIWTLFPFLPSRTAAEARLTKSQWFRLGAVLTQIHATTLDASIGSIIPRERFRPSRYDILLRLATLGGDRVADPLQRELASFWQAQEGPIDILLHRCQSLSEALSMEALPFVLCHADFHGWNVLVDAEGDMWIVDWDDTTLAHKERDLMFVIGGIGRDLVTPQQTASFLRGYGETAIDMRAITYYRYAWALQDIAAYGEQVCFAPELEEAVRRDAFDSFVGLFQPGNIVSIALASDDRSNMKLPWSACINVHETLPAHSTSLRDGSFTID